MWNLLWKQSPGWNILASLLLFWGCKTKRFYSLCAVRRPSNIYPNAFWKWVLDIISHINYHVSVWQCNIFCINFPQSVFILWKGITFWRGRRNKPVVWKHTVFFIFIIYFWTRGTFWNWWLYCGWYITSVLFQIRNQTKPNQTTTSKLIRNVVQMYINRRHKTWQGLRSESRESISSEGESVYGQSKGVRNIKHFHSQWWITMQVAARPHLANQPRVARICHWRPSCGGMLLDRATPWDFI